MEIEKLCAHNTTDEGSTKLLTEYRIKHVGCGDRVYDGTCAVEDVDFSEVDQVEGVEREGVDQREGRESCADFPHCQQAHDRDYP